MKNEEKILSETTLYKGKVFTVKKYAVELSDGVKSERDELEHSGGAAVLAVCDGYVYLVKQYRLSVGRELYEIPAGKLERGEDPADCARRELEEETGLVPLELKKLAAVLPSPGYTNEVIHVYRAVGIKKGRVNLDEDERLSVEKIRVEEALKMVDSGEIDDAKTVLALTFLRLENAEKLD